MENANWTVVDERKGELLPTKNKVGADFEFNKSDKTTAYQYYMIKVTRAVNGVTNIFLQMSEFGFGTSEMFFNSAPVTYSVIDGTRNNADSEALNKLFDGRLGSKWGVGGGEGVNWLGWKDHCQPVSRQRRKPPQQRSSPGLPAWRRCRCRRSAKP